ncbi:uncharacterized protein LOC134277123 [Saccostrea cucullata]|uniref:uncharacterized protein LOC134277123 n=1 Tax=Saccostrea cuccullata TaxID=36930 RepID=UPI002ED21F9F
MLNVCCTIIQAGMKPILILSIFFVVVKGSHFRGGIFTWRHISGNEVRVKHRMSWRNTFYSPVCDDDYKDSGTNRTFGTVSCFSGCSGFTWNTPSLLSVCTDFSTSEDWATYEGEFDVSLPSSSTSYFIGYDSCCWISSLVLNSNSNWRIATRVDLTYRQDIGGINTSPVTAMQPIVRLQRGCSHSIKIPVADDDGDTVRCRWGRNSPDDECSGICNSFPGAVLNEATCTLNYSSVSNSAGYYGVAIQIEDFASPSSSIPLSSIPLQFLVEVFDSSSACASAPTFISPTPPDGRCYESVQGVTFSVEIRIRTGTSSQYIQEVATQSPVGVTKSSIQAISQTDYYITLRWTPTSSQQGSYIICFTAEDNLGLTTESRCITLNAVGSSTLPSIVLGSQTPSGSVYGDNHQWSLRYSNYFVRPSTSTFIRIYESSGLLVERVDVTSSAVVYPQSTSGRQLSFSTNYTYQRGRSYYIQFDEGVANRELGCSVKSPAIQSTTFWTFSIYYVRCSDNPCSNSYQCTDLVGDYSCQCYPGFTDKNCTTNIDECSSNPCWNGGTCIDGVNSFSCLCDSDHYGPLCGERYIRCGDNPCENSATCSDVVGGYMCYCPSGYTGVNCSTNTDECVSNPCQNGGTCVDRIDSFSCLCDPDHYGSICSERYIRCRDHPCENNATCSDEVSGYSCNCPRGFTGVNCSTDIDECETGPCKNNASCLDGIDSYKCQCYPGFYGENCTERNLVRLMDGSTPYEGRVEIFNDGVWGTVCDDHWDDKDAAVVCGMLGYSRNNAKGLCCEVYGKGGPQIWLDNVECLGTEQDIFHCQHIGWGNHNCDNHEDAAVVCSSNDKPIRLVGGPSQYEGRLEIYYNGEWGTVCDDYWDEKDTAVVCQSLGFSSKNAVSMCCAKFGEGTGPILLDDVDCLGSETDIGQCKHRGWKVHNCQHLEDVSIRCSPKEDPSTIFSTTLTTNPRESTLQSTTPPATTTTTTPIMITTKDTDTTSITEISNKTIRLVGGATPYEGRVEVYYNGEWGTVCDDGLENSGQGNWNNSFSKVICRSLGYSS